MKNELNDERNFALGETLTNDQKERFSKHGFLHFKGFISRAVRDTILYSLGRCKNNGYEPGQPR